MSKIDNVLMEKNESVMLKSLSNFTIDDFKQAREEMQVVEKIMLSIIRIIETAQEITDLENIIAEKSDSVELYLNDDPSRISRTDFTFNAQMDPLRYNLKRLYRNYKRELKKINKLIEDNQYSFLYNNFNTLKTAKILEIVNSYLNGVSDISDAINLLSSFHCDYVHEEVCIGLI